MISALGNAAGRWRSLRGSGGLGGWRRRCEHVSSIEAAACGAARRMLALGESLVGAVRLTLGSDDQAEAVLRCLVLSLCLGDGGRGYGRQDDNHRR